MSATVHGNRTRQTKAGHAKTMPGLELRPAKDQVDADEVIDVEVRLDGLRDVSLLLIPKEPFSLDLPALSRTGTVQLLGRADGIATLRAIGTDAAGARIETSVHVRCIGKLLRLTGFGYIPAYVD